MTSIKEIFGDGHEEHHVSQTATVDTRPVSMSHFTQVMEQLAHMQQETIQNMNHLQSQIQELVTHPAPSAQGGTPQPTSQTQSGTFSQPSHVPPSNSIPGHIKLAKPSLFLGAAKSNVETWIFEVEQCLIAYGVKEDSQRMAFASASFKGIALQWWQNHCMTHPGLHLSWEQFKEEIRKRFQPVEASRTARVAIRN